MEIKLPELSLVLLIGPSGAGKSTFANKHFLPTEIISSDFCRGALTDDENDQSVSKEAFELVHFIARKRLALGKLAVIDATNVQREARAPLVAIAREYHVIPVALVFDLPDRICQERNQQRENRKLSPNLIRQQRSEMRRSLKWLDKEGFRHIAILDSPEKIDTATIRREPLWNNRKELRGPFDIIGDVHGCGDELEALLSDLGYRKVSWMTGGSGWGDEVYRHPEGRLAVFLGDMVDRGPRILDSLRIIRNMVQSGNALCVPGNHDMKFLRKLQGKNVQITHGLEKSMAEMAALPEPGNTEFKKGLMEFLHGLVSHYVLDQGRLVVAHAGMKQTMQGRGSARVRDFALYGETTGETDEFGLPVRHNWAADYKGPAMVVYGHTPVPEPVWLNHTVNIDTGCVFGGQLTALRYPEKEFVQVAAQRTWCEPVKPFRANQAQAPGLTVQQQHDDLLDAEDVMGKRFITTRLQPNITIRAENATAALETMSRFAIDPKWLIYLCPTMSPCETSTKDGYLEYPSEAFSYYRSAGVPTVVCEEKHMGSRAVVVVGKNEDTVQRRFGIQGDGAGIIYTRTGRRFFDNKKLEQELLARLVQAMDSSGFWKALQTDWACIDCELMPWSVKAQELIRAQYASVGAASQAALEASISTLKKMQCREGLEREYQAPPNSSTKPADIEELISTFEKRRDMVQAYTSAYAQYCWPVTDIEDLKLAPFHLLATEGKVHADKDHVWHLTTLGGICEADPDILQVTAYRVVETMDSESQEDAVRWWLALTEKGGEGMVVKPFQFITRGRRGPVQPAVKVRGREYLRIIYGPEYTAPQHLQRLRSRGLGVKRSLALREFALGVEALERFVRKEPLRRVHECVFGVLALESEPVDPRL